jgi:hypothetical protein
MLAEFCLRTLQARFGRYRECFRGKMPPEAPQYLSPEAMKIATAALESRQ